MFIIVRVLGNILVTRISLEISVVRCAVLLHTPRQKVGASRPHWPPLTDSP